MEIDDMKDIGNRYKSAYDRRNGVSGRNGKGLVDQDVTYDEARITAAIGYIGARMYSLDKYLTTRIGTREARAAMDEIKVEWSK